MARLDSKELQAAKKAKQAERSAAAKVEAARQAAEEAAEEARVELLMASRDRYRQLDNVVGGLYEEHDKLSRKWPTMPVTQRTVERVNKLLAATRTLLKDDEDDFVDGLNDIVAAGDMPETRDVVVLLREVKDALGRFDARYQDEWRQIERDYDWD